ncbi:hypothetical protein [Psychrobacillus sp. OK032]|uniref:hypothetical protein n=1 Tax=Psychrobacillus sp. OK032 TaxID=1884358 RepID=UPI0008B5E5D5|nr:hypothetical protein [Psychrobacillus sp. OK032]SER87392.1 hypothetical protein SAMN05518872_102435 [Psychrobacillus sp. OK032]
MALIPLKQTATITKPGTMDDWGNGTPGETIILKCRADETVKVIVNSLGKEVVSNVSLIFDKLPNIAYDDVINYTNELGVAVERTPELIAPIRMIDGKPGLTEVHL